MIEALREIELFLQTKTLEEFEQDRITYLAVIKCFEIVGEAAHHVHDSIKQKYNEIPWRTIKDFRNRLSHGYFDVDHEIVWRTAKHTAPRLKQQLQKILDGAVE
jgi:uncharacterized protein with HEPN domain